MFQFDASAGLLGLPPALVASFVAAFVASLGIVFVTSLPDLAQRFRAVLAAFASGVLLGSAVFIMPEAFEQSRYATMAVLFGYFTLFVFGRFAQRPEGRAFTAFFAIAAHSTIDGMGYGLLFSASEAAGILGSLGLIIHEFSEGIVLYLILRGARVPQVLAVFLALFGAAVTTPVGTLATLTLIPDLSPELFGLGLSFAAGALLYVGASQLPQEFGDLRFRAAVAAYALGTGLAVLMMSVLHSHAHAGGGHDHDDHHEEGAHIH